jgi:hypothetical protein
MTCLGDRLIDAICQPKKRATPLTKPARCEGRKMRRPWIGFIGPAAAALLTMHLATRAIADETSLFKGDGTAVAYIAIDDELTIYLWGGKPVAYLQNDGSEFNVYGFNGKHLGWFANGVIWDHNGYASCATKERLNTAQFEPFKSFKQFKPFKAFTEFAPYRPAFSNSFGNFPCDLLLGAGGT